jgi:hypothetical protein
MLKEKYGPTVGNLLLGGSNNWPRFVSRWWKDIVTLDDGGDQTCFNEEVTRKVHNGRNTSFWNIKRRGDMIFREKYPRLFAISNQKESKVADM